MSLFKPAKNEAAYLKAAFMGLAGSGKTYTACDVAIGLVEHMRKLDLPQASKPVLMVDSENGSSWMVPRFQEAGIELLVAKTTAFSDLAAAMIEARQEASVLLIDSITAFWVEFTETYKVTKKRTRGLEFQDWGWLKNEWRNKFTARFLNDPIHTIMCGRMGFEYDQYKDDNGKRQIEKTGVKLKAEGELGFEPSLLVQMEREQDLEENVVHHVAHILKDRRPDGKSLDGKSLRNPTFKSFWPHIEFLNLGGAHSAFDEKKTSAGIIPENERHASDTNGTRREIVIDEVQSILVEHFPLMTADHKQAKAALLLKHFDTRSWTEVEKLMPLFDLQKNYNSLHRELKGEPSRYGVQFEPPKPPVADDIPHMDAPPKAAETTAELKEQLQASVDAEPDDRDTIISDIRNAMSAAFNPTRINQVWREFAETIEKFDPVRKAKAQAIKAEALKRSKELAA